MRIGLHPCLGLELVPGTHRLLLMYCLLNGIDSDMVQIHEVGCDLHLPFFSMEYVAGGNLANAIHHRVI